MKRKVAIVTGCAGFLGSHFTRRLLKDGWRVYGIDRISYCSNDEVIKEFSSYKEERFKFNQIDICDLVRLPEADVVFHLAAESHVTNSIANSNSFINSNITGTYKLLELLRSIPKEIRPLFFHVSTDEVFGDIKEGFFTEDSVLKPSNPYAASKVAAEAFVKSWHRTYGIEYFIIRPTNMYGKDQYPEKLIPLTIKNLDNDKKIRLHNNGVPTRTWLHVEDCVDAMLTIYTKSGKNQTYNCSGNIEQSNYETVYKIVKEYLEGTRKDPSEFMASNIDYSYNRPGQDIRYAINDFKLRSLGWLPTKSFDTEISKIIKYETCRNRW